MYLVEAYGKHSGNYEVIGVYSSEVLLGLDLSRMESMDRRRVRISSRAENVIKAPRDFYYTAEEFIDG